MPADALPPSAVDKMAFLWRDQRGDVVIEEMWLTPARGVARGTVRLLKGGEIGAIAREMGYRQTGPDALNSWVIAIEADGKLAQHSSDFDRVRMS